MTRPFREELKYIIPYDKQTNLLRRWSQYLTKDPYTDEDAATSVLSQYYDSPSLAFYYEKLDGIWFRNKVRMRTYGNRFRTGQTTFLEIKQRLGSRVRKIREKLDSFHHRYLSPKNWDFFDNASEHPFAVLLWQYKLRPSAQIWYRRKAYESFVESDVRITFDSMVTALHPGEELTRDMLADPLRKIIPEPFVVLEIKATKNIPQWVTQGIISEELICKPIPKYVLGVEKINLNNLTPIGVYK